MQSGWDHKNIESNIKSYSKVTEAAETHTGKKIQSVFLLNCMTVKRPDVKGGHAKNVYKQFMTVISLLFFSFFI